MAHRETLYLIRQIRGITLKKMARTMGVTSQYLSTIEHCRREPTINLLEKIAAYHGITMAEFFTLADLLKEHGRDGLIKYMIKLAQEAARNEN